MQFVIQCVDYKTRAARIQEDVGLTPTGFPVETGEMGDRLPGFFTGSAGIRTRISQVIVG